MPLLELLRNDFEIHQPISLLIQSILPVALQMRLQNPGELLNAKAYAKHA